ncbi:MAG TPA: hypothetical protein VLH86_01930 [Patescibacteria group bacterium]|nr:hypothetical protein [Patescibacteria group bacterium]
MEQPPKTYQFQVVPAMAASLPLEALDMAEGRPSGVPGVPGEVIDFIADHAGNMSVTTGMAMIGAAAYLGVRNRKPKPESYRELLSVPEDSLRRFRVFGVGAIMGVAALANCVTETRWGIETFPGIAKTLSSPQPDVWDTITSTAWAGIVAGLFWRRNRS